MLSLTNPAGSRIAGRRVNSGAHATRAGRGALAPRERLAPDRPSGPARSGSRSISPVSPWTQHVRISWKRPLVSFVAETAGILQDLDGAGLLRRYTLGEERVGAKIKDALHQLAFGPEYIEFTALQPDPDIDALTKAVGIVWKRLQPTEVRHVDPQFRFITPASADYDGVRRGAGDYVTPLPEGASNVDFAIVSDLASDDPSATIHVECGIVERAEAAQRLAMRQVALKRGAEVEPSMFPAKSLPDVAVYDHQAWRIADVELTTQDEVLELWSRSRHRAEEIDVALSKRLLGETQ